MSVKLLSDELLAEYDGLFGAEYVAANIMYRFDQPRSAIADLGWSIRVDGDFKMAFASLDELDSYIREQWQERNQSTTEKEKGTS